MVAIPALSSVGLQRPQAVEVVVTMKDLMPRTPGWLYNIMGVWCLGTGFIGVVANSAVLVFFILSKKVSLVIFCRLHPLYHL